MGILEQVIAGLVVAAVLGVWAWLFRRGKRRRGAPAPPAEDSGPAPALPEAARVTSDVQRRLGHILEPLGSHLAGLGSVMLRFGPPSDRERRFAAIDELLEDYERLKDRLYELNDDRLVDDLRKTFREIRHDILPRARISIERESKHEEHRQHFGDAQMWSGVFAAEGGSLEAYGHRLRALAVRVGKLDVDGNPPEGRWSGNHEKQIRNEFFEAGAAHCPIDGAELAVRQDTTSGDNKLLLVLCPNCRRKAESI